MGFHWEKCKECETPIMVHNTLSEEDDRYCYICLRKRYGIKSKPKFGCECGANAAGTDFHSRWCPIYKDPMEGK